MTVDLPFWWLVFGSILMLLELLLPGLVVVFVGLGAITVSVALKLGYVDQLTSQITLWFISSLVYVFTLRMAVLRFYPTDVEKTVIDDDQEAIGVLCKVERAFGPGQSGRVYYSESTWGARLASDDQCSVEKGDTVRIIGRDNITWIVTKDNSEG